MRNEIKLLVFLGVLLTIILLFSTTKSNNFKNEETHLPSLKQRSDLGALMESRNGKKMIEIGVHRGDFARDILKNWLSVEKYYGIDPWAEQENYHSHVNFNNQTHQKHYLKAVENLKPFGNKIHLIKGFSSDVVDKFEDESLDLIYVDGRHDYCACTLDLESYWPKLKRGGIMAGHDYMKPLVDEKLDVDWNICKDGTRHEGAVLAAVTDFLRKYDIRELKLIYEQSTYPSYYFLKP